MITINKIGNTVSVPQLEIYCKSTDVKPMPFFMWTMKPEENQGYPTLGGKEINVLGAFGNCKKLRTIVIPTTVAEIGEYGFAKTALTAATISSDCHYSETSFPPRCIINYYN